jgi:HPt (histidine-containing phosphotransfer) domain-containing protein
MMLENLEKLALNKTMKDMIPAYDNRNYQAMKDLAHSLKGASGYIGASRLHYACYFIQEHFVYNRHPQMLEYYPTLVEAAIEFKVYSRILISRFKSKFIWRKRRIISQSLSMKQLTTPRSSLLKKIQRLVMYSV